MSPSIKKSKEDRRSKTTPCHQKSVERIPSCSLLKLVKNWNNFKEEKTSIKIKETNFGSLVENAQIARTAKQSKAIATISKVRSSAMLKQEKQLMMTKKKDSENIPRVFKKKKSGKTDSKFKVDKSRVELKEKIIDLRKNVLQQSNIIKDLYSKVKMMENEQSKIKSIVDKIYRELD